MTRWMRIPCATSGKEGSRIFNSAIILNGNKTSRMNAALISCSCVFFSSCVCISPWALMGQVPGCES